MYHILIRQIYQVLGMTPRNNDKEAKDECTLDIDNQNSNQQLI